LAGLAALRAGAGVLRIATCRSNAPHLAVAMPEARVVGCAETLGGDIDPSAGPQLGQLASRCDAVLIGPGMQDEAAAAELCSELLHHAGTSAFVLDAAAFTSQRQAPDKLRGHAGPAVVTPHSGEMAQFLGMSRDEVDRDPLEAARRAAQALRAVVAIKGASTRIVSPRGEALVCDHGSIALATSGSGDTLAGVLAGLLARGMPPFLATAWAVYLHGEAGRRLTARNGAVGVLAREIPDEIPAIMQQLGDPEPG
jgi:ADP-dependent NAD(P)H-hydrate dehydratase